MITTKIVFDRKHQAGKDREGTIEVRITVERRTFYISTGIRVLAREWKAGMIVNRTDSDELNRRLALIYEKAEREVNRCLEDDVPVNAEEIRKAVWVAKESDGKPTFLDWMARQTEMLTLAEGTLKHYRSLLLRLTEFNGIRRWEDVTTERLYEFDSWLHQRRLKTGEHISDAAVYKYHKCLKAMLNRADMFGKIDRNPYERMKLKRGDKQSVEYLTDDEMKAFCDLKLPSGSMLEKAHDLFVFQMFTGLSYSDTQAFDFSEYRKVDGAWRHVGERIKTGVAFVSRLLDPAVDVVMKYDGTLPKIDNSDYNRELKALGVMAGIRIPLHSHLARHTFATWMLRNGAKIENVSKMLGHTNITQTQRYAKVLAESVHDDFDKVAKKLK